MPDDALNVEEPKKVGRPPKQKEMPMPEPKFEEAKPAAKPKQIKRPFETLTKKHKVSGPVAAALRRFLPCDPDGMITETEFLAGWKSWLNSLAGSGR